MSVNAMNWAGTCRVAGAGTSARSVLDAVAWLANDWDDAKATWAKVEVPEGHAVCIHGVAAIADRAEVDESTTKKVLGRLASAGVLRRVRRYRSDGWQARRIADAILLDLTAAPVVVQRAESVSDLRRKAGSAGGLESARRRALRKPPATNGKVAGSHLTSKVAAGHLRESQGLPVEDRQVAPGLASGGSELDRQVAGSHRVVKTPTHTPSEHPSLSPEPGTARELWTTPVDDAAGPPPPWVAAAAPYRPTSDADAVKLRAALAEFGNRYDRRLPPSKTAGWTPLRPGRLSDPAFDGMVERVYEAETSMPNDLIEPYWWRKGKGARDDVWRYIRKKMLTEQAAATGRPGSTLRPAPADAEADRRDQQHERRTGT